MEENLKTKSENKEETDSSELTQEECDLYDLFINEYNDLFENVLNLKGKNFYSLIKNNVSLLIGKSNFNKFCKTSLKKIYNKLKEDYFEPDNLVIKYLEENLDSLNEKDLPILNIDSIFAHCNKCYECTHICGEPLYNYKYYDLIICLKCKMIYKKNMIRLFCNSCNEEYYSYFVDESNYKEDFFPATWEKYHCFSFNYDRMSCPECAEPLYYSELKKILKCFKCNWSSNPNKIMWECDICGEKFNSKVKEFVKYETKPEINCVKYALINRIYAKPYMCNCCGTNPIDIHFFHPDCGGAYYLSYLQNKFAVVCEKCKIIQNPENVKWGCGNCKQIFSCDKMIVLEKDIEKEKRFGRLGFGNTMTNFKSFSGKNNKKFESDEKRLTSRRENNNQSNNIKGRKSQKLKFNYKIKENNKINSGKLNCSVRKNLGRSLRNQYLDENKCKDYLQKINNYFLSDQKNCLAENSQDFNHLKKNVSEKKINFKSYNRQNLNLDNDTLISEYNGIDINNYKTENNQEKENDINENKIEEKDIKKDKMKKHKKIKIESSKNIITKELKPIREKILKKIVTEQYNTSAFEEIKKDPETKNQTRYIRLKNSYLKQNINPEKPIMSRQSQKALNNISLNFSVNININNILDNKDQKSNNNNNSLLEPEENFNPNEFRIVEKIGSGSFGKIYKVQWIRNNKNYAMKIINLKHIEDFECTKKKLKIIKDFYNETNCPGIIRTYGNMYEKIGKTEYKYYILMELAQIDWEKEINSRNKKNLYYTQNELFDIIKQLVTCYALMQKNNIGHRDVKPQNVLLLNGQYKLCDFGEARNISGKNGYIHQPIRGSELYMSPILFDALNNDKIDVLHNSYKSDVFSLGMCFFLAATLSFDSLYEIREEKDMRTIKKILEKYLIPRYSNTLVKILYKMLQVDEDLRPNFIELEKYILSK
jgi:hypothetical protein